MDYDTFRLLSLIGLGIVGALVCAYIVWNVSRNPQGRRGDSESEL
jgi:hypothetical protein